MFGYVRPNRDELKVRELRDYEALYCGLCHALGRRHGFFARFFLNYDFTFLAMLLDGSKPTAEQKRCPALVSEKGLHLRRKRGCGGGRRNHPQLLEATGHGGGRSLLEGNCRPGSVLSAPTRLPPGGPGPAGV